MKVIARAVAMISGVVLAFAVFGTTVASADPYIGLTYAEASGKIAERNGTPVVATVSGSQLAMAECTVVSWSKSIFRDSSGDSRRGEFLLNLNCNRALAGPGHPGGSLMSPGGPQAKEDEVFATKVAQDPGICDKSASHAKRCARVCPQTKLCEYEA